MENVKTAATGQSANSNIGRHTYMWILTLQWPTGGGFATSTSYGTAPIPVGTSRKEAYEAIRAEAYRHAGREGATTLFFSLEPDQMV
ncbi:hypothetical protein AB0K16_52295 [Nonomuraea jabiensis]|uniref:hypothetical protein n=1 Tax=Nonomuraea jabiensis TaxID=882448 RepID=UPI00344373D0